jgi:hypothetical protein
MYASGSVQVRVGCLRQWEGRSSRERFVLYVMNKGWTGGELVLANQLRLFQTGVNLQSCV